MTLKEALRRIKGNRGQARSQGPAPASRPNGDDRLGGALVNAVAILVVLAGLRQLLRVPSGYGIEDMLGWTSRDAVAAIRQVWALHLDGAATPMAALYLGLDFAVFMPLYAVVFAALWHWAYATGMRHASPESRWAPRILPRIAQFGGAALVALLLIDLVENLAGLDKLGVAWGALLGIAGALPVLRWVVRRHEAAWLTDVWNSVRGAWLSPWWHLPGVALALGFAYGVADDPACGREAGMLWFLGCHAHAMKPALVGLLLGFPAVHLLWLQFASDPDSARHERVAAARRAVFGIAWRSRYALLALGACTGLMLVMNQGRDVIYAMASHASNGEAGPGPWAASVGALGLTAASLLLLGYSCWLWTRLGLLVADPGGACSDGEPRAEDVMARDWARLLGIAPAALLLALALATFPNAVVLRDLSTVVVLGSFALLVLLMSVAFIYNRDTRAARPRRYYRSQKLETVVDTLDAYRVLRFAGPKTVPAIALTIALACRAMAVLAPEAWGIPTLTLPIMLCLVTFWLSVAGWISLYEFGRAVPWFLLFLLWVGALGLLGLTENHRVPMFDNGVLHSPAVAVLISTLLGALMLLALRATFNEATHQRRRHVLWTLVVAPFAAGLVSLALGDHYLAAPSAPRPDAHGARLAASNLRCSDPTAAAANRNALLCAPQALSEWLNELCRVEGRDGACSLPEPLPVYLLASEGGGIRSAYWTALAVEELRRALPRFEQRTFGMTGVSGGSVGLAVYRACSLGTTDDERARCIDRFGRQDLLAALVGSWFYEDVIARLIPVRACEHPGCGFMSRGLWFEHAMVAAVDRPPHDASAPWRPLALGMIDSRERRKAATKGHVPYLFFNSTWVETGERSIASELVVDWQHFPGARDQIAQLGQRDVPLVTGAHNSARFTFTNALGAVHASDADCAPEAYAVRGAGAAGLMQRCGHLADGGYFDNSGGQTASDLLRLLHACLSAPPDVQQVQACPGVPAAARAQLAAKLRPQLVLVRNGVPPRPQNGTNCSAPAQPTPSDIQLVTTAASAATLGQPLCAGNAALFVDTLGPLVTALGTTGVGSNGRLAAARARAEAMAPLASASPAEPDLMRYEVKLFDLVEDGPLYPLGWHLSRAAQRLMKAQAQVRVHALYGGAAMAASPHGAPRGDTVRRY